MRTCFVHVPIPLRKVDNRQRYWANFDRRYKSVHPAMKPMRKVLFELPHWVPWLTGVARAAGFDDLDAVELYTDCTLLNGIDEHRIVSTMRAHEADVYLFSPMTTNLPQALRIAELVKGLYPSAKTVFGGVVATPLHRQVAAHPCVDYVVRDRGEYALPDLLRRLRGDEVIDPPRNLTYTDGGTVVTTPGLHPYPAVADIPFPVVDIFPAESGQDVRYIRQNYALGCPFTCDFCTIQTIGRKPSYFPISRVLAEIDAYREHYGRHHHLYFGDETFTLNPERTLELCSALADRGDIQYDCQTRLNCFRDARLPEAMFESGCRWVELGLESANQGTQDDYKQHTSLSAVETTLARLAWLAVVVMGVFATALCFAWMNHAQQFVSDVHATLVYALEPVWSAVAGFLIGERFTPVNWIGAAVIVASLLLGDSEPEDDRAARAVGARTVRGGHGTGRDRS